MRRYLKICEPIYCINKQMLKSASKLLGLEIPNGFETHNVKGEFEIKPGQVYKKVANFLMIHFLKQLILAKNKKVTSVVTLTCK
ncbi:MAG: hypothetical protein ACNI3H_05050 [Halarcobacter ebronensis]